MDIESKSIIEICVALDIAILGIAYPIIVDKISNIGDKYSSQYIPVLFNNEFPQKTLKITISKIEFSISTFKLILFATLFSFIFLIFKTEPLFGWDNWVVNNSASILVFFLTSLLTIFFFTWLGKVVLYSGKAKSLLTHVINNYYKLKTDNEIKNYHLKAINELTLYAISKQDEHLQETLLEFYYKIFAEIRKNHDKSIALTYPVDLYFLVNRLNEEAIITENRRLRAIEHRAVSGSWLLGLDFENIIVSEQTYNWLWQNIYIICEHSRLIKMFWAHSSQYYDFRLRPIQSDYNYQNGTMIITNQTEVDKRNEERNQFLEFHYALGGLLLYREQYKALKYLFAYSQSQPPNYVLLPQTMTEIFQWFEDFRNEFKFKNTPIDLKYYFPELDNLGNRLQVNHWICSYIALLFLRQYSLHKYYIFQDFTAQPSLPNDVIELGNWLDGVSYFERCLNGILSNQELIEEIGFNEIIESNKENFTTFLNDLRIIIKNKIGEQKVNAELSTVKVNNFYQKTNEMILNGFNLYRAIFAEKSEEHNKGEINLSVTGEITLISKSAFTDGDIPHFGYDSVVAESIVQNNIKRLIPYSFEISKTNRYLLNNGNIAIALNKIIDKNKDIVIVGVNISYKLKDILDKINLKGQIHYIPSTQYGVRDALFILRKKDLPTIDYKDLSEDEKKEFQLVSINKDLNLYASVIDLTKEKNEAIKDKWNLELDNQDLKVQIAVLFRSVIYWRNAREVIQINIASEFSEQGIQNDINDIKPLNVEE